MSDAVPCLRCGRAYAAERFATGRPLTCACGERVGRVLRTPVGREAPLRFAADSMLGGLARWLRVLGYDTTWQPHIADPELVRRALAEERALLTRDVALSREWWLDSLLFLRADAPLSQLAEVVARFPLSARGLFSRCLRCNSCLESVGVDQVGSRVPPAVLRTHTEFRRCPLCERVYWDGSHTERMRREIAGVRGIGDVDGGERQAEG